MVNRYKLTVGNAIAFGYADTEERAKSLAEKLARTHAGEVVVCLDMQSGVRAFTVVYGCRNCE